MTTKRQKCSRCKRHLTPGKFAPASRGKSGKLCRSCRREHRQAKRAEMKSTNHKEAK